MTDYTPELRCIHCSAIAHPIDWQCRQCGNPIDIVNLPAFDAAAIDGDEFTLWRYGAMLPFERRLSLGEGLTPLVWTEIDGSGFYAKLEYLNPTGSYKDRGTVGIINHFLAHDVPEAIDDSSGNAGASLAAYAGAGGIKARVFVPATGSESKKRLIQSFGAVLEEIPGSQHAKTEACIEAAKTTAYASHAWSPFFVAGQMTAAWEVWEQLGRRAPAAITTPVGHGGLFLGFARGFKALYDAGLVTHVPKMIAVQSAGCDPIVRAWENGDEQPVVVSPTHTVADGIIVEHPVRGVEVLRTIREMGGTALRVDNEAITTARTNLSKRGFVAEPTSATPVAALSAIRAHIGDDGDIVIALTGSGLKNLAG